MSNIQYERHTKASFSPSLTNLELSYALLPASEVESCGETVHQMLIKDHLFSFGHASAELLIKYIKEDAIMSGDVVFRKKSSFGFSKATRMIVSRYGLSGFHIIGTKNKITGIVLSSVVTAFNPDEQVKKYAAVVRAIKQKYPDRHFELEECQQTIACDARLTKALQNLLKETQPASAFEK